MKLKQRVIMMSSLFLTMVTLFVIGTHLASTEERQTTTKAPEKRSKPPAAESTEKKVVQSTESPEIVPISRLSRHLPPGVPPEVLERFNRMRPPHEMLEERLRERAGKVPHKGRFPLSEEQDRPIRIDPWTVWQRWVTDEYFYPDGVFYSPEMNQILEALATSKVTEFGVGYKGTQLKATMMLGPQRTVFKPKRYDREMVIGGEPYSGFDRHNGEIAGFHLDGILGFRLAPPVVGRKINLTTLRPVTSQKLLATYFTKGEDTCFYGECYYCKREEAACADGEIMEGSVTLWLPEWYQLKTRRHPYQRTYKKDRQARWERDDSYCKKKVLDPSSDFYPGVLEYTDTAVYDFLMGNADRHHYEVYANAKVHGRLIHIDNGKTFGDPHHDEMSILAPITQCCRVRSSTWSMLQSLEGSSEKLSTVLDNSMRRDPLYPILSQDHLTAIDRRLEKVIEAVRQCIDDEGKDSVIVDNWN